jgi:penicillin amidase
MGETHMRAVGFLFRAVWKMFKWGFIVLVLALVAGFAYLTWRANASVPNYDATVVSTTLGAEVRVVRDSWGVPHIQAESEPDAYFALGYCMAQERLFQMEVLRRLAQGRLAELLGPIDPVIQADRIMRAFRLRAKAEEFVAMAENRLSPELNTTMNAFIDGVNQFLKDGPLPWEFSALLIPTEPFTKADCLAVAAILPITFADGLRSDPLKTILKEQLPERDVDLLFRGIEQAPVTIMEGLNAAATFQRDQANTGAISPQARQGHESAAQWLDAMAAYGRLAGTHLGSNSWVLSGDKTASGKPILANDPHIGFTNPSIWFEAHMKYGDFENYGYHFPPIPMALLGHNEDRGWGLTMFANDDVDMYLEKVNPENPNQVMFKGEWVDCEVVREVIKVRLGSDVVCDVRITPHGPIVNDLLGILNGYSGPPISLRWVWQNVDYTDVLAFYEMSHARDLDTFEAAVMKITSPGLNISYADAQGNIAWWAAGLLPIRPPHVDPKALLEGWSGRDEIEHYLPLEDTPHLKNPPSGIIATANNFTTTQPVGTPPLQIPQLQGYFKPGDRAGRILEILEERDDWTIEDLRAVQMDDTGFASRWMAPIMTGLVREHAGALSQRQQQALAAVEAWDFRHNVESTGATVFEYWVDSLLVKIFGDEMTPKQLNLYATIDDHWIALQDVLTDLDSTWWDDVTTETVENPARIALEAFKHACGEMAAYLGEDFQDWTWGRAHTVTYTHPFGYLPGIGRLLNIGPLPTGGAEHVVNNMLTKTLHNFGVIAGPSTRRLIDFATPAESLTILPTGNSGHVRSPHYDDQAEMFARGEYRPALYDWRDIEADRRHEMRLLPR